MVDTRKTFIGNLKNPKKTTRNDLFKFCMKYICQLSGVPIV